MTALLVAFAFTSVLLVLFAVAGSLYFLSGDIGEAAVCCALALVVCLGNATLIYLQYEIDVRVEYIHVIPKKPNLTTGSFAQ